MIFLENGQDEQSLEQRFRIINELEGFQFIVTRSTRSRIKLFSKKMIREFSIEVQRGDVSSVCLAYRIVNYSHETARALFTAAEKSVCGVDDPDPCLCGDILRSMLVMAASGLDATLKQIFRDSLNDLVDYDPSVKLQFEEFVGRQLKKLVSSGDSKTLKMFASAFSDYCPRCELFDAYRKELLGGSLQSVDELHRASAALGIQPCDAKLDKTRLKEIFHVRNQIIHDLDIDIASAEGKRFARDKDTMISYTNTLLEVSECFLKQIDNKFVEIFPEYPTSGCPVCG